MKLVCISDTHNQHTQLQLPAGDVLVCAGDVSSRGTQEELRDFLTWFADQPHRHKILVGGNHDAALQGRKRFVAPGVLYLEDAGAVIEGVRFFGAPWRPRPAWKMLDAPTKSFGRRSAFGVFDQEIAQKWAAIPDGIDVLITHVPPIGILDRSWEKQEQRHIHLGCPALFARVQVVKPRYHIFGHIHDINGNIVSDGVSYHNVSICDPDYAVSRSATVIEVSS